MNPSRPGLLTSQRRSFWRAIRDGASTAAAAEAAGFSGQSGKREFRDHGGVPPLSLSNPSGYRLNLRERDVIAVHTARGDSIRQIAAELGRAPSTISRELRRHGRNKNHGTHLRARLRARPYLASTAHARAELDARRPKPTKLASNQRLRQEVQARLRGPSRCSPEQISNRLRTDFPDDPCMRVSDETIYKALYVQGRGELRRELTACLRTGRSLRRPARRSETRGVRATRGDMVMISERPAVAEDRAVPGHWEGDLITGAHNASAVVTLVERTTRFVLLAHLPHAVSGAVFGAPDRPGHGAVAVREAIAAVITTLPVHLRQTLTWDQGVEMAQHVQLAAQTDLEIYFCDPHSPWQRGSNENTNGLLRQYLPKGSDLSRFSAEDLAQIADGLNDRPRKTLGWRTPREAMNALLSTTAA